MNNIEYPNHLPINKYNLFFSKPQFYIYLGDANKIILKFPSESIDLILTDPPYGINYNSNMQLYRNGKRNKNEKYFSKIHNDNTIPLDWLWEAYRILKNNSAIYIFTHWKKWPFLYERLTEIGFKIKNMIIINKTISGMGDLKGSYAPKYELILFATKGRHLFKTSKRLDDIWNCPVLYSGSARLHPNQKPIEWFLPAIKMSSSPNDIILDPFTGSGSVGEACLKNSRNFIGIEIEKEYHNIALKRLDKYK